MRWSKWYLFTACCLCLAAVAYWLRSRGNDSSSGLRAWSREESEAISAGSSAPATDEPTAPPRPKLPETKPPPGLPITDWGHRDLFPVIRTPAYVDVAVGDTLLLDTEPVLGVVVGNEARAYSTNQLNKHEMVIDDIAGVPVLVTY